MNRYVSTCYLAVVAIGGFFGALPISAQSANKNSVISSWKAAGFAVGWMEHGNGVITFHEGPNQGVTRFFVPRLWKTGAIRLLPEPVESFGLSLLDLEDETELSDDILKEISSLKKLSCLYFDATNISPRGLDFLKNLRDLQCVVIISGEMTNDGFTKLANIEKLRKLVFVGTAMKSVAFEKICNLHSLTICSTSLNRDELKQLSRLKGLRTLALQDADLTDASCKALRDLKNLRELDLCSNKITDEALSDLSELHQLRLMRLSYTGVTAAALTKLAHLRSLESLYLDNTHVGDKGLESIGELKHLLHLDLTHSNVTKTGLKHLTRSRTLRELTVRPTGSLTEMDLRDLHILMPSLRIDSARRSFAESTP